MISSFKNKFMFIFLLTVDNNRNNKRVWIKLGHDCARFASFGVIDLTIRRNSTGKNWENVQNPKTDQN